MLAEEIGSFHLDVPIDSIVSALLSLFERLTGKRPRYKVFVICYSNFLHKLHDCILGVELTCADLLFLSFWKCFFFCKGYKDTFIQQQ
jgi:hypothetical protein